MVNAVMFVAALSEYDHTLFEDESENRMVDALNLFGWVCQQSAFAKASILLFLNKRDLFEQKVKKVSIASVEPFSDYSGKPNDFEAGVKYFQDKFMAQNKNPSVMLSFQNTYFIYSVLVNIRLIFFCDLLYFLCLYGQKQLTIYPHVTCATDSSVVRFVFTSCKEILLQQNLADAALF
jgi:guanine nucleotide-binding protein G(i) subunit alpha